MRVADFRGMVARQFNRIQLQSGIPLRLRSSSTICSAKDISRAPQPSTTGATNGNSGSSRTTRFLNENFRYHITDPTQFDDGTATDFRFPGNRPGPRAIRIRAGPDPSEELDDQCRPALGPLSAFLEPAGGGSALLDFPLFSVGWIWSCIFPMTGSFRLRPSKIYCFRVHSQLKSIDPSNFLRLPVEPSEGNYYEAGLTKVFCGKT